MSIETNVPNRVDAWSRTLALSLFLVAVFFYSWNSDDAYHSYIMARHLVEGKGLVYNTGYRVSASTCPLLTLIEAFFFLFTDSADLCGLLIGLLFSGAAAWVLFFRICPSPMSAFCMLGLMVSSRCFLSFTTSGLENPLLFFFGALFFDIYHRNKTLSKRYLFALALLMSLLAMARTDSVLIFIPMAVWAYLTRAKVSYPARVMLGVAGLLPFVFWTLFSLLYYGFPFPNTYYAKLYTGIPLIDYVIRGLWYYPTSWIVDPLLLVLPVLVVSLAYKTQQWRSLLPLFIGLATYCLYVVAIGGDFMVGRHFTEQYFLTLCAMALLLKVIQIGDGKHVNRYVVMILEFCAIGFVWNCFVAPLVNDGIVTVSDAINTTRCALDERDFYIRLNGNLPLWKASLFGQGKMTFRDSYYERRICSAHESGDFGLCFGDNEERFGGSAQHKVLFGHEVYTASDYDMYLTDVIALQDPLMARLKVDVTKHWRVGHIERMVPCGYHETLASGENCIEDPSLHEYYDKLLLLMTGPLFDRDRLWTIVGLNCGKYDRLLESYEHRLQK